MWIEHRRDVVIVGGGHAAAAIAKRLLDAGLTVVLVDSGMDGDATVQDAVPLERLRREDFGPLLHYDAVSPGWPLSYDQLATYYERAEQLCDAKRGAVEDPFLADVARRLHAVELPTYSPLMGRLPTPPATAERIAARAIRLETDALGREVLALVVENDDGIDRIHADAFVLAGGATATPALLLRSASALHPNGLGNESGAVGRFAMCINRTLVLAVAKRGGPALDGSVASDAWYFGAPGWPHPLGHLRLGGSSSLAIQPTPAWPESARPLEVVISSASLPEPANRVTLGAHGTPRIALRATNMTAHRKLNALTRLTLTRVGFAHAVIPAASTPVDLCGTARIGKGATSAAADENGRVIGVDNVYIADGSALPGCGAVDPALTTIAFALRVGDHVAARLGATRSTPEAA